MNDLERLCERIKKELVDIGEKGLTTSNLENANKLIDMYKDLKEIEAMEEYEEGYSEHGYSERGGGQGNRGGRRGGYSREGGNSYNRGNSYRGGNSYEGGESYNDGNSYDGGSSYARRGEHYVRGHYSRAAATDDSYNRYMDSKKDYRYSQSSECKQRLMDTVDEYMDRFTQQMEEMLHDSDCAEERNTIKRYLDKLRTIA